MRVTGEVADLEKAHIAWRLLVSKKALRWLAPSFEVAHVKECSRSMRGFGCGQQISRMRAEECFRFTGCCGPQAPRIVNLVRQRLDPRHDPLLLRKRG
jgi:hypothetical protein